MTSENNELIDQATQYLGEASDRLSECAEELELTKDQGQGMADWSKEAKK